jgi:lycopene cyclase domain-containing protein
METSYLFLEGTILVFFLGFCWEHMNPRELMSLHFWLPAAFLAALWFTIDQIAIGLGLWNFPYGGTIRFRLFAMPLEEYILFLLHTFMCFLLLKLFAVRKS